MTSTVGITTTAVPLHLDSLTMVEQARRRAAGAGLAHVGFVHADAQTQRFAPLRFDAIVSTRAQDAFADPDAGFTNLARALRPGGSIAVVSREEPDRVHAVLTRAGLGARRARRRRRGTAVADARPRARLTVSWPGASGCRCRPTGDGAATAPEPRSGGPARG
jgi:protein-L-isoaspartate O-methyltransferase